MPYDRRNASLLPNKLQIVQSCHFGWSVGASGIANTKEWGTGIARGVSTRCTNPEQRVVSHQVQLQQAKRRADGGVQDCHEESSKRHRGVPRSDVDC
jgi:hypothetical protein